MTDIAALHRRALDTTGRVVADMKADQLDDPSPNDGWSNRDLLNHVVAGNYWAGELAAGKTIAEVGDRLDGDLVGDDPAAAYDRSAAVAAEAFERPGALDAPCAVSYGPVPGSVYAGHRFVDVLIHGWDLAVGTGQDATLDPELVEACREVLAPQLAMLQASGVFGTVVHVPDDASPQAKLLADLGRRA